MTAGPRCGLDPGQQDECLDEQRVETVGQHTKDHSLAHFYHSRLTSEPRDGDQSKIISQGFDGTSAVHAVSDRYLWSETCSEHNTKSVPRRLPGSRVDNPWGNVIRASCLGNHVMKHMLYLSLACVEPFAVIGSYHACDVREQSNIIQYNKYNTTLLSPWGHSFGSKRTPQT